jgi:uncharacterized protein (TIGR02270 family)
LPALSEQYLDLLALEWRARGEGIDSYTCDFRDLCEWDDRMQAYADALVLIDGKAGDLALKRLEDPLTEADLFAIALQALRTRDRSLNHACLALVHGLPQMTHPYRAALEWASWPDIEAAAELLHAEEELQQILILHALAHHEVVLAPQEVDHWLQRLAPSPEARITALRCSLLRGEPAWAVSAREWIDAPEPELQLTAAEALITFGDAGQRRAMLPRLRDLALTSGKVAEQAARGLLVIPCTEAQDLLDALSADPGRQRLYLQGLGWAGDIAAVPILTEALDDPAVARISSAVIGMLTGSNPVRDNWQGETPALPAVADNVDPDSDDIPLLDPDSGLPWPSRAGFEAWWQARRDYLPPNCHYLAGRPRESGHLLHILHTGCLAWRHDAAWLIQIMTRGRRLACTDPAPRQQHLLNTDKETNHA